MAASRGIAHSQVSRTALPQDQAGLCRPSGEVGDCVKRIEHDYGDLRETAIQYMQGYAGVLPATPEDDLIARLHEAVKDVTGKPVEPLPRPRMGFLP